MALKIVARPEFDATVTVNLQWLQGDFKARFVARQADELDALQAAAPTPGKGLEHMLSQVCVGLDEVELPDGALRFEGPDSVLRLLAWPGLAPAMSEAYFKGLWEAARGN